MNDYIDRLSLPDDLKDMSIDDLELLSYEIRDFLVEKVSKTGGHLSSNLGAVELSIALHKVFDTPEDRIIWDVGHQTYVHKILTGRAGDFDNLRQMGGMSGFPKKSESPYDVFDTGHSSSSISLALGMAAARDMAGDDYEVISVIGDGAMTGGLAFEALNNVGSLKSRVIVILNDNGMSISHNTGGFPQYLMKLRSSAGYITAKERIKRGLKKIPVIGSRVASGLQHAKDTLKYAMIDGIIFEELGFKYFGPIDGHDMGELCKVLELARQTSGPVFIHAITKKGKGYSRAEEEPDVFHGIGPFDVRTGKTLSSSGKPSYSRVFAEKLTEMAGKDDRIVAVSAAMMDGTGLDVFRKKFPKRAFDVGIAEGHAVTFAAGLARAGMRPFVAIYSTFLQRAYDQIMEDVCLQKLPVTLCIDRAGIVGADGETHHGVFDISYLKHMPGMTVMAPKDADELRKMLELAASCDGPCAIRYPRGEAPEHVTDTTLEKGRSVRIREGKDVDIWALGAMTEKALGAADILKEEGVDAGVVNMAFVKPFDEEGLRDSAAKHPLIVTVEDNVLSGGAGEDADMILANADVRLVNIGWPDRFIEHGTCDQLYEKYHMDSRSIAERIMKELERQT